MFLRAVSSVNRVRVAFVAWQPTITSFCWVGLAPVPSSNRIMSTQLVLMCNEKPRTFPEEVRGENSETEKRYRRAATCSAMYFAISGFGLGPV